MPRKDPFVHNPPLPRNYAPDLLVLDQGEGVYVDDVVGNRYLDFGAGIAVNALGYGREDIAAIAYQQMLKLIHTSNVYTSRPTVELAARLVASGAFAAVHLGNSGTEANEAAIKYARLYAKRTRGPGHHKLVCFEHAFHGRTMGALSVTPNERYREAFEPLVPGVITLRFNDPEAVKATVDDSCAGVIVEVIQGEGGLTPMTREFAAALNEACRTHDVLLIDDEIQAGLGRTGKIYAAEHVGLQPDIVTLAKPLAGGLPLSATLIPAKVNDLLKVGDHGTTFGGGPVTSAVARFVWDTITQPAFLEEVREKGQYLATALGRLTDSYSAFGPVRGMGMLRGIPVGDSGDDGTKLCSDVIAKAREEGVLLLRSGANVLRAAPPLVITNAEIDEGIERIFRACERMKDELS